MQPPDYTPQTDFSDDEANNTGGRSTIRTDRLDVELDDVSTSINAIIANLMLLQRDDGKLLDGLIEPYNFSAAAKAFFMATKWTSRGLWGTATSYVVNDLVDVAGVAYVCAIAHTSDVFATDYTAGRWQIFTSASTAESLSFTPTANITSTNAQNAIEEVDTDARANSNPTLSAFYGGF